MYKKLFIFMVSLIFLVSCKQEVKTSGGDNLSQNNSYKAIYLDKNLYLVTKSNDDLQINDIANITISNSDIKPKMGQAIIFEKIDGINETYPVQTAAYDVQLIEEIEKGANVSINKVERVHEIFSETSMLIDVRTPEEYAEGHLEKATLIPLDEIENRLSELDKNKIIFVHCRSGKRSGQAQEILENNGFFAINAGGVLDYEGELVK